MRQPLVIGNWKMNGRRHEAEDLLAAVVRGTADLVSVGIAVCPPYLYLPTALGVLGATGAIACGAQDVSAYTDGAFTGEVSAEMIRDIGCRFAIIGHSERRTLFGETDAVVAKKFARAQEAGLTPVLCVGETAAERDQGQTELVVSRQIEAIVAECGAASLAAAVLAYEPVWAIGTGRAAAPAEAQRVHAFIRRVVARHSTSAAQALRVLYGGSVKAQNARDLFIQDDIDGGLIGGASLLAAEFVGICRAAHLG